MRTHLALLRGINVGGRNKVAMADLRELVGSLGHAEVGTYIQSGNVLFAASNPRAARASIAQELEDAIAERLTVRAGVVVVTLQGLQAIVRANPFPQESNAKALHAVFLREPPDRERLAGVEEAVERARAKGSSDEARVVGEAIYLRTPDGLGRSLLAAELARVERRLERSEAGTARNWATVKALLGLFEG